MVVKREIRLQLIKKRKGWRKDQKGKFLKTEGRIQEARQLLSYSFIHSDHLKSICREVKIWLKNRRQDLPFLLCCFRDKHLYWGITLTIYAWSSKPTNKNHRGFNRNTSEMFLTTNMLIYLFLKHTMSQESSLQRTVSLKTKWSLLEKKM